MSGSNRSLRIKTDIGNSQNINVNLTQDYDTFEILSLKVEGQGVYKLHNSNYGVVVGRVLANDGFGVPNAKISIFIEAKFDESITNTMAQIYPFSMTSDVNYTGKRYNLLPDDEVDVCHQVVGSFPNKTYLLDNDVLLEVFDKYYKYTTRTNNSGDYIICGVPTGNQKLHMDLDLSDCGILSQRPRDFVYKGYTIEQFENPNQFKVSDDLNSLSQIISQDQSINVIPFWGNENEAESIGITRADINISFKFEPTCIFMGCIAGDNQSNGISKKCIPTEQMGAMDELVTGEGTIEMIRKTMDGDVEEFQIKGTQLIDGNGVWCYQIPMNLDYVMTDEYGNIVATDDPSKGIPTRAQVRFRISMQETEQNMDNYFRAKVLIPHNPQNENEIDYNFGSKTKDESFRDLFWNNVYTVKSYIPRFQKSKRWKNERFSGIKHCNIYGNNNPIPYNNIRIRLPFMFIILCALIKGMIKIITFVNRVQAFIILLYDWVTIRDYEKAQKKVARQMSCTFIGDGLCPDLDGWYFAPGCGKGRAGSAVKILLENTLSVAMGKEIIDDSNVNSTTYIDETSTDYENRDDDVACLTTNIDYFLSCIEMNLAQEYKVIQFDFYNDWINGLVYMPRWMRQLTKKRTYLFGLIKIRAKNKGCYNDSSRFGAARYYTQQCNLKYDINEDGIYTRITTLPGCKSGKNLCHKKAGMETLSIFGKNGGIVTEFLNMNEQYVYYFKPCEWVNYKKVNLFANDLVLLGSLHNCDERGVPQAFKYLSNSSFKMPTNLALTNMDDMSYLYANENDTICSNKNTNTTLEQAEIGVHQLPLSFKSTRNFSNLEDTKITYVAMDDVIPTTEAAGIAWNYTGPGQGVIDKNKLYYPGGHFLGLSCTNSQTNIKSCINLQRVCEIGVNISQRREFLKTIKDDNGKLLYTVAYHIPTGFIGKDEIIGDDFRAMFATMNTKRLIADTVDNRTGYPIYSFSYHNPTEFNGSFNPYVTGVTPYNQNMNGDDVENGVIDEWDDLKIVKPMDYDPEEVLNSSTRTIENTSLDYYLFRFGLTHSNYKQIQASKFAKLYTLPQYENSYYFYFGLKEGSTALDEFMKQFFSNCEDGRRKALPPEITLSGVDDRCTMTSNVTVLVENMTPTYSYVANRNGIVVKKGNNISTDEFIIEDLPFGNYTITVTDSNNYNAVATINLGKDIITLNAETVDFTFKVNLSTDKQEVINQAKINDSGYIIVDKEITIGGSKYTIIPNNESYRRTGIIIEDIDEQYYIIGPSNDIGELWKNNLPVKGQKLDVVYEEFSNNKIKIYLWEPNTKYNIYIGFTCYTNKAPNYTLYDIYDMGGKGELDLYLGSKSLSYNKMLYKYNGEWWKDNKNLIWSNTREGWLMRHWLFRQNIDDTETFDSHIVINSLTNASLNEILFGTPENNEGVLKNDEGKVLVRSNDYPETYSGYNLNDKNSVFPTYGPYDKTRGRIYFGKTAIDEDNTLLGEPISGITITEIGGLITEDNKYLTIKYSGNNPKLIIGHGCAIQGKDFTIYPIVESETEMKFYNPNNRIFRIFNYDDLLVYPLFMYPVIYKPFYAEANFLESGIKTLVLGVNQDNIREPQFAYRSDNFSADGYIYNGVTYEGKFGLSTINSVEVKNLIGISLNDMNEGENWDRETLYGTLKIDNGKETPFYKSQGYNEDTYSFYFSEGYPSDILNDIDANTPNMITLYDIEGTVDKPLFYDYMTISSSGNKTTFNGYPYGNSDKDVKYYIINLNGHMPFMLSSNNLERTYYIEDPLNTEENYSAYIMGEYNSNAPNNVIGEDVIISIKNNADNGLTVSFPKRSGSQITTASFVIEAAEGKTYSELFKESIDDIRNTLSVFGAECIDKVSINVGDYNATDYYKLIIDNGREVNVDGTSVYDYDVNTMTLIGLKETIMEDGKNKVNVMKLYPDMIPSDNYDDDTTPSYLNVSVSSLDFNSGVDTKQIIISSNVRWNIISAPEWLHFDITTGGEFESTFVNITSDINITGEDRNGIIKVQSASISKEISVSQNTKVYTINVLPRNITLYDNTSTDIITVIANDNWEISSDKGWCILSHSEGIESESGVNITVSRNYNVVGVDDEAVVTANNNGVKSSCKVISKGIEPELILNNSNLYDSIYEYGETITIEFTANTDWVIENDNEWCTIESLSGSAGNITVDVVIDANITTKDRNGKIVVKLRDFNESFTISLRQKTNIKEVTILLFDAIEFYKDLSTEDINDDNRWEKAEDEPIDGYDVVRTRKSPIEIILYAKHGDYETKSIVYIKLTAMYNNGDPMAKLFGEYINYETKLYMARSGEGSDVIDLMLSDEEKDFSTVLCGNTTYIILSEEQIDVETVTIRLPKITIE